MESRARHEEQPLPLHEDAECKVKSEKQEVKEQREALFCTEQLVQDGSPAKDAGPRTSLLSVFHTVLVEDEFGKILDSKRDPDVAEEGEKEDGGESCYIDEVSRSPVYQPSDLGGQDFTTKWRLVPNYFSDVDPNPSISGAELHSQPESQVHTETKCLHVTEKETKKKRNSSILVTCSTRASSVAVGEPIQDVNQNLPLSNATRRSARCTAAVSTSQHHSRKVSSVQVSRGNQNQDKDKEKECPPEHPGEPVASARKKTRTYYSAEQLDKLERMFQDDHYPDSEKRREIAASVGVTPQRVMVWFQNRRAKWRKIEKLTVKVPKKCPSILSIGPKQSSQGLCLLPVPPNPDKVHSQPVALQVDSALPKPCTLSGQPESLASATETSVTEAVDAPESVPMKAVTQSTFGPVKEEPFPAIPSPPPIQRTSLSLSMTFNPNNHIIPLMLDAPSSEYSPPASQESQPTEVFTYNIQRQSGNSPEHSPYSEQLEPTANLETPYFHPNSQSGAYLISQYSQPQGSHAHHIPVHLTSSILPSVRITPATPSKSGAAFFSLPANGGLMGCQTAEASQGYLQNHIGGQLLIQPAAGSSGYIPAFQTVPWNEFYVPGALFSNPLCSQVQGPSSGGRGHPAEQVPGVQNQGVPPTSCLLQLPRATMPGSTMVFTAKQVVPADPGSNQDHELQAEHLLPPERDSRVSSFSQEEQNVADFSEESNN